MPSGVVPVCQPTTACGMGLSREPIEMTLVSFFGLRLVFMGLSLSG
jgi:hypothetical protein